MEKYCRVEKALINAILESYIQGVSTRKVRHIMEEFGVTGISAETVSHMGKALDEKVNEFLNRPIEQPVVYLIVDAVYVKVRHQSRYVSQAILIIAGIREDGYREILGIRVADCEDEGFWFSLFEDLKLRGLRGVQLVISDGHKGNDDKCQIGRKSVQLKSLTSSVKFFPSSINAIYSLTNRSLIVVVCAISRGGMRPYSILTRLNALM